MTEADHEANFPSLYVALPKPPEAISLTVRKLLGRVETGAIRVPTFQRPLRWTTDDVIALFDSLFKGYPVGSLLFWKHSLEADSQVLVGSATVNAPATTDGWFIVDGQQRTTALAASLLDLDQKGDTRWDLWFDAAKNAVVRGPLRAGESRTLVPLRILGNLRRLGLWLRECDLDENAMRRVEEIQERILDYELPAYAMETGDVNALRGVFARLNSTGVRMRADEVFHALLSAGTDARASGRKSLDLSALQAAADVDGFGQPPRGEILKAVLAMSGLDPTKRLDKLRDSALSAMVTQDEAAEALRRTVRFLQTPTDAEEPGVSIPAYALLPYPVVFVLLARWFHLFPEPDAATTRALGQWLWRGVATGVHERAAVSAMRLQVREIQAGEQVASLRRLLDAVGSPNAFEWSLEPFHANHAASRVEILALLSLHPRDRQGLTISWRALLSSGERVAREVFRLPLFKDSALRKQARTAANRVLLDTRHTHLRTELKTWNWKTDREAAASHLICQDGLRDLKNDHFEAFLARRAARVRACVTSFVFRRAGLSEPLVLPANAYFSLDSQSTS